MQLGSKQWVEQDGVTVPEARAHDPAWLPHEYGNQISQFFIRAVAAEALPEVQEMPDALERRGEKLGRTGAGRPASLD